MTCQRCPLKNCSNLLTQGLFVVVFVRTARDALCRPHRIAVNAALLFGTEACLIALQRFQAIAHPLPDPLVGIVLSSLLMALPFLLLRLVDAFAAVPRWLMGASFAGLVLCALGIVLLPQPFPLPIVALYVLYFIGLQVYATAAFI